MSDPWNTIAEQLDLLEETSSSTAQVSALTKIDAALATPEAKQTLSSKHVDQILLNVTRSFERCPFHDKQAQLVQKCFGELLAADYSENSKKLGNFIAKTGAQPRASADEIALLQWIHQLAQAAAEHDDRPAIKGLIASLVTISGNLADQVGSLEKQNRHHSRALRKSFLLARQTYKDILKLQPDWAADVVAAVSDSKLPVAGIASNLGSAAAAVDAAKLDAAAVSDFFVKTCLVPKISIPAPALKEFASGFVAKHLQAKQFEDVLLPGLQKGGLRNSELTFADGTPAVFAALQNFDAVTSVVASKFFAPLLNALKSSKETVRAGGFESLKQLATKHSATQDDSTSKLVDELLKILKSLSATSVEQKSYIANIFDTIPLLKGSVSTVNAKVIAGLLAASARDTNEASLGTTLRTLYRFYVFSGEADTKVVDATKRGLQEKKQNLRAAWACSLGYTVQDSAADASSIAFTADLLPLLVKIFEECSKSPLPSINNKLISGGYAAIYVASKASAESDFESAIVEKAISFEDSPSMLVDLKLVEKLTNEEEQHWWVSALYAVAPFAPVSLDLGYSFLYSCASHKMLGQPHILSYRSLNASARQNQRSISESCVNAINAYINRPTGSDLDLDLDPHYLYAFIMTFTEPFDGQDKAVLEQTLIQLLVPCHHKDFSHIPEGWIGICQAVGVDPGALASTHADEIVTILNEQLLLASNDDVTNAACEAVSTVSFIAPTTIVPKLTESINDDLSKVKTLDVDDQKLAIWKGVDGELVFDPLEKTKSKQLDKNTKDYQTLKWEQDVRKEIASKNKSSRKLSKEEQQQCDEQLKKETLIRQSITADYKSLKRGLETIISLSNEAAKVDNNASVWYPVAVSKILELLNSESAKKLIGELATECFLTMSRVLKVTGLTGTSTMDWIGASTLRLHGIESIPVMYKSKDIKEVVYSQLFSLKVSSDKTGFDSLTLMYILPLLITVIENGRNYLNKNHKRKRVSGADDYNDESQEEELLALSLSIIASNNEAFEDESIPRSALLDNLIALMAVPSKAKLAKETFTSLCQSIAVNVSNEDLDTLFKGVLDASPFVRTAVLESLDREFELSDLLFNEEIWIARFDEVPANSELASTIWEESKFELDSTVPDKLLPFLGAKTDPIRIASAKALAAATKTLDDSSVLSATVDHLLDHYREKSKPPAPKKDAFGLDIADSNQEDSWEERSGVAHTLKYMAPQFTESEQVEKVFKFLVEEKALADKSPQVRHELQSAGMTIIDEHGKSNVEFLIKIFESGLSSKSGDPDIDDRLKESTIVLYGNLAHHLDEGDSRVDGIVTRLLAALDTPSEDVQFAVSEVIAPLTHFIEDNLADYYDKLFTKLFTGKKFAQRRGAAYGIAGLTKGVGLKALPEYDILRNLEEASDDKSDPKKREGVIFAIECLSQSLGALFEPYVLELLPIVLKSFGDAAPEVREATGYAAKEIMKNTTSYGIKKLIPMAIENLDDTAWRAKKGSVELLGSMAFLDPAQLSSSLPKIVPEIVGVLNDSHKEVRKAADKSLNQFGEVIRNPEIQEVVPTLLKAIGDPTKYTDAALDGLINTQFVHYIDGPSMALIIHVIDRGMHDRSASTKKKACQIVGNMSILVDPKDLDPYLPKLVGQLQESIVDPVPQTRSTASRALGSLVERLGEEKFPALIPTLLSALQDQSRPGDRMGSAQGLAEIIRGIGLEKLDEMLPDVLAATRSSQAHVRAGFLPMLIFLPACFGTQYAPYLSQSIPPILNGLADSDDDIRDTALKAGRLIVNNYANKAIDLLLPELEKGMSDDNGRIRLSSVELTGELLFKISGITGNQALSEDPAMLSGVTNTFNEILGEDKRNQVLASLFICRSDTAGGVRVGSTNIWKALVANTPKTVKEILPTLTQLIVRRLASPNDEQRSIAASALGDMVKRVGGNALTQLLPTLEEALVSSDSDAKQGICIALRELIESSSPEVVIEHQDSLVKVIRSALTDANPSVREAAAQAFDVLQSSIGNAAVDEVIPQLLEKLNDGEQSDDALSALQEIMSKKADVIFPILIPTLLKPPINAKALSSLAEVAGPALFRKLTTIFSSIVNAILDGGDREELLSALSSVVLSVDSDEGCHPLMQEILALMRNENHDKIAIAFELLPDFFKNSTLDYSVYTQDLVTQCILALDDDDKTVAKNALDALTTLVSKQSKASLGQLVAPAEQTLHMVGQDGEEMYAFSLPRGPNSLLPIFLHGLMYGDKEQKELSADAISYIVDRTPAAGLRSFVTLIVGPLIRVIGERVPSDVKSAILMALNKLFAKIPQFLRPFIPQLQRTFIKSLSDNSNEVLRNRAAKALGTLIEYQPRVDPLVTELLSSAKTVGPDNVKIQTSILKALLEVVNKVGTKLNESSKNGVMTLVEEEVFKSDVGEDTVVSYARLIGALSKILSDDEAVRMLREKVLAADMSDNNSSRFAVLVLNAFLKDSPETIFNNGLLDEISEFINNASNSASSYVSDNGTIAAGKLLLSLDKLDDTEQYEADIKSMVEQLAFSALKPNSNSIDTRRLSLVVLRTVSRYQYEVAIRPYLDILVPSVFACVRDSIIPIKLAAEKSFLAILNLVNEDDNATFNAWVAANKGNTTLETAAHTKVQMRSITEYVKRVASRLAASERERISAGGDQEAMFSDQFEDEREIWAIGGVDLSKE